VMREMILMFRLVDGYLGRPSDKCSGFRPPIPFHSNSSLALIECDMR